MSIATFIRDTILKVRLEQSGCLAVYDPEQRYRDLCRDLASDRIQVIDAGSNGIPSREAASLALCALGQIGEDGRPLLDGLLIYVPKRRPLTDELTTVA